MGNRRELSKNTNRLRSCFWLGYYSMIERLFTLTAVQDIDYIDFLCGNLALTNFFYKKNEFTIIWHCKFCFIKYIATHFEFPLVGCIGINIIMCLYLNLVTSCCVC